MGRDCTGAAWAAVPISEPRIAGSLTSRPSNASMATQSPSALRPMTPQPGRLEGLANLAPRDRRRSPTRPASRRAELVPQRGRQRDEQARDQVREDDVERLLAAGQAPARARTRRAIRLRRALAVVASMAIGSVSTPNAEAAPSLTAAMARMPEPQPTSSTRAPASTPAVGQRFDRGEAQPGRRMEPGPERHPRIEREHDVAGPRPDGAARSAG